jgi:hypothetical protein
VLLLAAALILMVALAISKPSDSRRRAKRHGGSGNDDYGGGFRRMSGNEEGALRVFRLLVRIPVVAFALMSTLLRLLTSTTVLVPSRRPRDHTITMSRMIKRTGDRGGSSSRASPAGILAV